MFEVTKGSKFTHSSSKVGLHFSALCRHVKEMLCEASCTRSEHFLLTHIFCSFTKTAIQTTRSADLCLILRNNTAVDLKIRIAICLILVSLDSQGQGKQWNKRYFGSFWSCDQKGNLVSSVVTTDGSRTVLKSLICSGEDTSTSAVEPEEGCCVLKYTSQNCCENGTSFEDTSASLLTHFSVLTYSAFRALLLHMPCRTHLHWLVCRAPGLHTCPLKDP